MRPRRQLIFSALLGALSLPLAGCPAPDQPPTAKPRPSCGELWTESKIPPSRQDYDFASDARASERGNIGYAEFAAREERPGCEKEWTVLVYMMADYPGLPPAALWNLYQMETAFVDPARTAGSSAGADVLVQLDVFEPPGIRRLHMYRSPAPFAPLETLGDLASRLPGPDKLRSPIAEWVDEDEEAKLTSGESLRRFLAWGTSRYPARHYLVIVWGHGFGWRSRDASSAAASELPDLRDLHELHGGIAPDASQRKVLDIPSLHDALADTSRQQLSGRPFDLYVSDACLMQSAEVVNELADVVRYVGGAEAKLDPLGLPYRLLVPYLNGSGPPPPPSPRCPPQDAACQVAALLPELTQTAYNPPNELYVAAPPGQKDLTKTGRENLTYSAVDTHLVAERLQPALQKLGAALLAYMGEEGYQMERHQDLLDLLQPHPPAPGRPQFAYAFPGGARDLGSVLGFIKAQVRLDTERMGPKSQPSPAGLKLLAAVDEADAALRQAVLTAALGSRYSDAAYAGMAGLSVWLPTGQQDYAAGIERFATSRLYQPAPSTWRGWIDAVFASPK